MRKALTKLAASLNTSVVQMGTSMPPVWANIIPETHKSVRSYDIELDWRYGVVDLSRVVSIDDIYPIGRSLGDLLGLGRHPRPLKRVASALQELSRNPVYYLDPNRKDGWAFYDVDGEFHMSIGLARTVVAWAFLDLNGLPPLVRGVSIAKVSVEQWRDFQI